MTTLSNLKQIVDDSFKRQGINQDIPAHSYQIFQNSSINNNIPQLIQQFQKHREELNQYARLRLYLWDNQLGPRACQYLSKIKLENLTILNLSYNWIGNEGCRIISKAKWKTLQLLDLTENGITEKGCESFARAQWRRLQYLNLNSNPIGKRGHACLVNKFTNCQVWCEYEYKTSFQ